MRYAIFSDIHSNLEALENVLAAYDKEGVDKYLCVGDIVGYGANPKECIQIIRDRSIITVAGNHDWAIGGKFSIHYFNPYAREAIFWTEEQLDKTEWEYLNSLELVYQEEDFCLVHGSLTKPEYFEYLFELSDTRDSFEAMRTNLCFVGHTHSPITFTKDSSDRINFTKEQNIKVEDNKKYVINVGSVGQPRDGDSRGCFCIYDSKERTIQIKRFEYDIKAAQSKILNVKLPSLLATRLGLGQ
ncbi:MAG: metallophosphoesterase family protein [Candidatus Omnitrophota bacterium]